MADKLVERVQQRLTLSEKSLAEYRRKIHSLREILAGNTDALLGRGTSADQTEGDIKRSNMTEFTDIFVNKIEEGRDNRLMRAIRTLGQQTTYQFPEIEAEHLEYNEANLHSEYFRQRLGASPIGCDAVIHMRRALYDYASGGMGWVWIGMQAGKPVIRYVDTIDCKWDQQSSTIGEGLWWSTTMYRSLAAWEQMFGKGKFDKYIKEKNASPNTPIELEYYYDIEGKEGNWMVLFKTGNEDIDMEPVFKAKNPCSWNYGGQVVPFLPAECMFFMEMPSVRLPIGLMEQMLPSQMALWRVEESIQKILANPGHYEYEKGAYDAKELQAFEDGESGSFLEREANKPPMQEHPPMQIPPSHLQYKGDHSQELVAQSGADPYASGSPVEGTSYAAEVNAIKSASGLMAGTISKENADFWLRMIRKFIAKGAAYDEWPLIVRHEDVTLTFDESDPIKQYLRPDTKFTIREDSMQFVDQQTIVQQAMNDVNVAASVAQMFPNALKEAYKTYLRARKVNDIDKYLAPPNPAEMALTAPTAAPQM